MRPPAQARFGSGVGGIALMTVPLVTMYSALVLSLMTNARWAASDQPKLAPCCCTL